jgi:hypothetical protein
VSNVSYHPQHSTAVKNTWNKRILEELRLGYRVDWPGFSACSMCQSSLALDSGREQFGYRILEEMRHRVDWLGSSPGAQRVILPSALDSGQEQLEQHKTRRIKIGI